MNNKTPMIEEHKVLAHYTTFKIGGPARYFCTVRSEAELEAAVALARVKKLPIFILGGGSNILVADTGFSGLVIKIELKGIEYADENIADKTYVVVKAAAGELWDELVAHTVENGLYGLENLSAIPGTVGAAPVQNIGAYGADASETIAFVRAYDTEAMKFIELKNSGCHFSYRDSVFKHLKGRYVITRVDFKLTRNGTVNISYKDLKDYFAAKGLESPTLAQVREAVIEIRWGKLPDWKLWGTAGSFFKNPIVTAEKYKQLKVQYPGLPGYPESEGRMKVSLAWILDKVCNVRGLCMGDVCTYQNQALVVVAKPGAKAADVVHLTHELMKRVKEMTGIEIEGEVEWVN